MLDVGLHLIWLAAVAVGSSADAPMAAADDGISAAVVDPAVIAFPETQLVT